MENKVFDKTYSKPINIYELNETKLKELRETYDLNSSISNFDFQMELTTEFLNDFYPKISYSEFCKIMNSIGSEV